ASWLHRPLALPSFFIRHSATVALEEFRREDNRRCRCTVKETCDMTVNAPAPLSGSMDVDEFMAFLETRPKGEHWHLIEGVAVMMAPPSYAHQRITQNFCPLLNGSFTAQRLDLYAYVSTGVRAPGVANFQPEPDVAVVPGISGY